MKYIYTFLLITTAFLDASAQSMVVINDPDGYVNVRDTTNARSKIVDKAKAGVVMVVGEVLKGGWASVSRPTLTTLFPEGEEYQYDTVATSPFMIENGFVYQSRIIDIQKLKHIGRTSQNRHTIANAVTIKNDSVVFTMTTRAFQTKGREINKEDGWVSDIDGRHPFGEDGDLPKIEIANMRLTIAGKPVLIPLKAYNDLFEPDLSQLNVHFDNAGYIYLYMPFNSDGAGYYEVVWVIKDRKLLRRYVDNSEA